MKEIYSKIIDRYEEKHFSVLATLTRRFGSAPRGVGAFFLILDDGSSIGTIGGGSLEARVIDGAKKVFHTQLPMRLRFFLDGEDASTTEMICGGNVDVFLEPISPDNVRYKQLFQKALEVTKGGEAGIMATMINEDHWESGQIPKVFLSKGGEKIGTVGPYPEVEGILEEECDRVLKERQSKTISCCDRQGQDLEIFIEPIMPESTLYIFGAGHVSTQIVPLASRVGFSVVVIDDRTDFADSEFFPDASRVLVSPFEGVLTRLSIDDSSFIVIVTRGHLHDKTVLEQSLKTSAKYIGMIGSRRKRALIYESLLADGFTQTDLDRVFAPIGLDIGAETPEEIAVSIVAELIKTRAGASHY